MIISASRRTDIPAFYGDWFMRRIRAGFCLVVNPFRPSQITRVSLAPADVDAIVFWTKNPVPFLPRLDELDRIGRPYYFLFTLNPYPAFIEPAVPDLQARIRAFQTLSARLGPGRVIWRYDPLIFSEKMDAAFHIRAFDTLAGSLAGATRRVIVSVVDWYRKTQRRLQLPEKEGLDRFSRDPFVDPSFPALVAAWQKSAAAHDMSLQSCAEDSRLADLGIPPEACIDGRLIMALSGRPAPPGKATGQRPNCLCSASKDIGAVNSCLHGCAYCYSTVSQEVAQRRALLHNPDNPLLIPLPDSVT